MAAITFEHVRKVFDDGTTAVRDLTLEIRDGEFMVLVGPSGCGKTTALRMIAGLEEPSGGEIRIGERVVNDLDPRERDVAMVFQNYALYPHMDVYDNIAFGLRMRKVPKQQRRETIERAAQLLGLTEYLQRKPRQLSGGQRQRVAMGRAIVREPQAFLMDEPLSNLDARLRVQMRTEISRIQRELGVTTVYVTHDQVEAMTMGDRVAVLRRGVLQQLDTPQRVYDEPTNLFVASFIGSPAMNLLEGIVEERDGTHVCRLGEDVLTLPPELLRARPALAGYGGRRVAVGIRPEEIHDAAPLNGEAAGKRMRGRVRVTEALEGRVDMDATGVVADLRTEGARRAIVVGRLRASAGVRPDETIELGIDTSKLHFFDLESGKAIAA
jgi:multiple sugar transport system ATP-binding protein